LTYAVGIGPQKIPALAAIQRTHDAIITLIVDSVCAATAAAASAAKEQSILDTNVLGFTISCSSSHEVFRVFLNPSLMLMKM
jgi:hypothetical protein